MNLSRKVFNSAIILFIFVIGLMAVRNIYRLGKEGMPQASLLEGIGDQVNGYIGVVKAGKRNIVNKTTYLLVEQYIIYPKMSSDLVKNVGDKMRGIGWVDGRSRSREELTLCRGNIVVDIDGSSSEGKEYGGYVGVSWGTADARCP